MGQINQVNASNWMVFFKTYILVFLTSFFGGLMKKDLEITVVNPKISGN